MTSTHIGTGETKHPFEYRYDYDENAYFNYDFSELLRTIDSKVLLEPWFLNSIKSTDPNTKKNFNQRFRQMIQYDQVTPRYVCDAGDDFKNTDVFEQMKTLNQPIIPGSSIKGAIQNAVYYCFLKDHFLQIKDAILNTRLSEEDLRKKFNVEWLLNRILNMKSSEANEFLKIVSSCFYCADLQFEDLEILKGIRKGKKDGVTLYFECIAPGQEAEGSFIKFEDLSNRLNGYQTQIQKEFCSYYEPRHLIQCCNTYMRDILKIEKNNRIIRQDSNLMDLVDDMLHQVETTSKMYLRVGKNTDYFFKSISLLFKTNTPEFYRKHFWKLFAPVTKRVQPDTMPTTRLVLEGFDETTLGGFLEIDFND